VIDADGHVVGKRKKGSAGAEPLVSHANRKRNGVLGAAVAPRGEGERNKKPYHTTPEGKKMKGNLRYLKKVLKGGGRSKVFKKKKGEGVVIPGYPSLL